MIHHPYLPAWAEHAQCATYNRELFFSHKHKDITHAMRICAQCPALKPCLEQAITNREQHGVWGGQLFHKGKILTSKPDRGRPAQQQQPGRWQLPETPIPEPLRQQVAELTVQYPQW